MLQAKKYGDYGVKDLKSHEIDIESKSFHANEPWEIHIRNNIWKSTIKKDK